MKLSMHNTIALTGAAIPILALAVIGINFGAAEHAPENTLPPPVLSVVLTQVEEQMLPVRVAATGHVFARQEAIISAESDGLKLFEVAVDVGDKVKRGQLLARFNADIVGAELAEASAAVTEAEATAMEAELNFTRAKSLEKSKTISAQQLDQTKVATMTANAKVAAARALEQKHRLRVEQTQVRAPSDGIISSRTATVGTVVPSAQELFRLIENGQLEWRAVIASSDMTLLAIGQAIVINGQQPEQGTLRTIAPTIDTSTHSGLVYVDLPPDTSFRAGSFVRGYIEVSNSATLTLPQSALILRDGFHYTMKIDEKSQVVLQKVTVGKAIGELIEITGGLNKSDSVIASGLGFLNEGDRVRIVDNNIAASFAEQK